MPELPDLTVYVERLTALLEGEVLREVILHTPFVLRTVEPPLEDVQGRRVCGVSRLGKRVVLAFEGERFIAMHLMVAGRLRWHADGSRAGARARALVSFQFDAGRLRLTEAGAKRRAALHVLGDAADLAALDRGGIEVMQASAAAFRAALRRENHTLKRALTDPAILSGIGNAYSDEILHAARLSPFRQTRAMSDEELDALREVTRRLLGEWTERLRAQTGEGFPEKVTAFRPEMAVHGRYREPCPACGAPVQRIVYASNESNYCARCQTGGRLLADRALSRLLKANWPKRLEELEG